MTTPLTLNCTELIKDPFFEKGFIVYDPEPGALVVRDTFQWNPGMGQPVWGLAQWSSKYPIQGAPLEIVAPGIFRYSNPAKRITTGNRSTSAADLTLAVDSRPEWGTVHRTAGQPWPHLLLQQTITNPYNQGDGCPPLTEVSALNFQVEARLLHAERFEYTGYTPSLHAAQYQIFFTVQNLNQQNPGFGKYLWLGIPMYDDRWEMIATYIAHDPGTATLIYTLGSQHFTDKSMHTGEWVQFKADLYPIAIDALNEAWSKGYLLDSKNIGDYRISGMNLGWEVPGINHVEVQIRNLSLDMKPVTIPTSQIRLE